jgi:hypothetical protein
VHAAVRDDREARKAVGHAVVPHEGRPLADQSLPLLGEELRDEELILGIVVERSEIDRVVFLADERGRNHESERGDGDDAADERSDAERGALEEAIARIALHFGRFFRLGELGDRRGGGLFHRRPTDVARDVADPQEPEEDRDHRADSRDGPTDDQSDEDEREAAGKREGPDRRRRVVGLSAVRRGLLARPLKLVGHSDPPSCRCYKHRHCSSPRPSMSTT